jgi:hypothetical protein
MMKFLDELLMGFRVCFTRQRTFAWFVVIVVGIIARGDSLGAASVMRSLLIEPALYVSMLGFFRSGAWSPERLMATWWRLVLKHAPVERVGDYALMASDGMKRAKEGRRMPGAKVHHQESDNSGKAEYIWGHLFGAVGVLASKGAKRFCIPLAFALQDGVRAVFSWGGDKEKRRQGSHVVELITLAHATTTAFGKVLMLMDRLYLSIPALKQLDAHNQAGGEMQIITRAKSNCAAYREPGPRGGGRGRPRKRGQRVKLWDMFGTAEFSEAAIPLYGKKEAVRFHHIDLLWGTTLYRKLRFVLVKCGDAQAIFVSTDITLAPELIIELYGRRFKVECMFREMNQAVSSFSYRFWSKSMPKLNKRRKKSDSDPLEAVTAAKAQAAIINTVKATEGYVFCCAVATGFLQMASMAFSEAIESSKLRFLRTRRNDIESEATIADYIRKHIFYLLQKHSNLPISKIIIERQMQEIGQADYEKAS